LEATRVVANTERQRPEGDVGQGKGLFKEVNINRQTQMDRASTSGDFAVDTGG
jgi:hypothetical protein